MPDFLAIEKSESARLQAGQSLEFTFKPQNPGEIQIDSSARTAGFFSRIPGPHRVEVFKPGSATPVFSQNGSGVSSAIEAAAADVNGDNWRARLTNTGSTAERARLTLAFPGTLPVRKSVFPASAIETLVNTVLEQIEIHITRGTNASTVVFPEGLNIPNRTFTIGDLSSGVLREYPNDINSSAITLDLRNATADHPNGSLALTIDFEQAGREIKGTLDVELDQMRLVVVLGLSLFGTSLSYDTVSAEFSAEINVKLIPDNWVDPILHFRRKIKDGVESAVVDALSNFVTCQKISKALTSAVTPLLGENSFIAEATIEDGNFTVLFFEASA